MTHRYKISGMTCTGCQSTVQSLLSKLPGVQKVTIDLASGEASIDMEKHIATEELKAALKDHPKYQLSENGYRQQVTVPALAEEETRSWIGTYKPILLIFGYISTVSLVLAFRQNGFDWMRAMNIFMAGFFLSFSFFKMLDLKGFAESYSMYDIVARRVKAWGYMYAFIELGLGIAYASNFKPLLTNSVTFVVMTVSIIGVLQSVLNKRKIRCACLGAVFNLPMTTVTIIEDALMIVMSAGMIFAIA